MMVHQERGGMMVHQGNCGMVQEAAPSSSQHVGPARLATGVLVPAASRAVATRNNRTTTQPLPGAHCRCGMPCAHLATGVLVPAMSRSVVTMPGDRLCTPIFLSPSLRSSDCRHRHRVEAPTCEQPGAAAMTCRAQLVCGRSPLLRGSRSCEGLGVAALRLCCQGVVASWQATLARSRQRNGQ